MQATDAIENARIAIRLDPDVLGLHFLLAWWALEAQEASIEEAWGTCRQERWIPARLTCDVYFYELRGDREKADQAWNELLQVQDAATPGINTILSIYHMKGEDEAALDWLEQNADKILVSELLRFNNDPDMAELIKLPRFQQVLHQLGIAKEQLAEISFTVKFDEDGRIVR
jgi:hypothetical protein